MFFLVLYGTAIGSALARMWFERPTRREQGTEVLVQHLLVVGYGLGGVFAFLGHRFRADEVARSIGWPTCTFSGGDRLGDSWRRHSRPAVCAAARRLLVGRGDQQFGVLSWRGADAYS
jgi:hypothetical protein